MTRPGAAAQVLASSAAAALGWALRGLFAAWHAAALDPGSAWVLAGLFAGAGALAGLAAAPWILALARAAVRFGPWRTGGVLVGAVVALDAGGAVWATTHRLPVAAAVAALVLAVAAAVVVVARRPGSAPGGAGSIRSAAALAAAALSAHALLPAHVRAHAAAEAVAFAACLPLAALVAAHRLARTRGWGRAAVLVTLVAAAAYGLAAPGISPAHRALAVEVDPWLAALWRTGRAWADADGDGAASAFGGRDCAPFDPYVAPGRYEVGGNGIDDDCLLGDLAPVPDTTRGPEAPLPDRVRLRSVLVILVDALRPDHMGLYGYGRPTTPAIDAAFGAGVVFERAYAPGASTRDAVAAILTGRSVSEAAFFYDGAVVFAPSNVTLPRLAGAAGFSTFAVVPFVALNMLGSPDLGFEDETVYDDRRRTTAPAVVRAFERHVAAVGDRPFFGWVHLYEPHEPYVRHRRFARALPDRYDQEVAAADAAVGRILAALRRAGRSEDTLVVLLGDHGEAFGEHGHRFHNAGVYEEDVRVPLLLVGPEVPARRIEAPVSTAGLARLLVDTFGWPDPGTFTVGGLGPAIAGAPRDEPVLVTSRAGLGGERFGWIAGAAKVHFDRAFERVRVFDLAADPGERVDLALRAPGRAARWIRAAAGTFERRVGAATTAWARARAVSPAHAARARPFEADLAPGVRVVAVRAERTRPAGAVRKLPARVLVHTFVRIDAPPARWPTVRATVERDGAVLAAVDGPLLGDRVAPRTYPAGTVVEDVRTFKVYVEDDDARVVLQAGPARADLGPVRDLPVARWRAVP